MIVCGREEPIYSNSQLHEFDENDMEIILSRYVNENVNRYGFVSLASPDKGLEKLSQIPKQVFLNKGSTITQCLVWKTNESLKSLTQKKWRIKRLSRTNWHIHELPSFGIALRQIPHNDEMNWFEPPGIQIGDGALFLISGSLLDLNEIVNAPFHETLYMAARNRHLIPSRSLLNWLEETYRSVLYFADSHIGHSGFIIVGPHKLPIDKLVSEKLVSKVFEQEDASLIWQYHKYDNEDNEDIK